MILKSECGELSQYTDSAHTEVKNLFKMYELVRCIWQMWERHNFIFFALPVEGLPMSQDWLDRMKLVCNHTIPISLPCGKNILVNVVFKISVGYTNLDTRQIQNRLGLAAESAFSLSLMPIWLGTQQKIMSLLAKFKKSHFRIKGCSSFIYCKAWRDESESNFFNIFGCNWIFDLFQGFNDFKNVNSKYGCWIRQSHGNCCLKERL